MQTKDKQDEAQRHAQRDALISMVFRVTVRDLNKSCDYAYYNHIRFPSFFCPFFSKKIRPIYIKMIIYLFFYLNNFDYCKIFRTFAPDLMKGANMTIRKAATTESTRLMSAARKATESKANSLAFLQRAGIVSKSGNLTPMYQ